MIKNFSLAARVENLPDYPFAIIGQRLHELRMQGREIIQVDMGSPDLPPPSAVIETLATVASQPNKHGYAGFVAHLPFGNPSRAITTIGLGLN
ncbi:MAG: hypothetical protein F9K46_07745 [Anaerolineae bacterium]|nr:MAG: hypothetical protein F9K46_07745 [Anaerolineae bacterium]